MKFEAGWPDISVLSIADIHLTIRGEVVEFLFCVAIVLHGLIIG
jgi:hypothetical protein